MAEQLFFHSCFNYLSIMKLFYHRELTIRTLSTQLNIEITIIEIFCIAQ